MRGSPTTAAARAGPPRREARARRSARRTTSRRRAAAGRAATTAGPTPRRRCPACWRARRRRGRPSPPRADRLLETQTEALEVLVAQLQARQPQRIGVGVDGLVLDRARDGEAELVGDVRRL